MHVGLRELAVPDPVQGAPIPVRVLYPTTAEPRTEAFGIYTVDVARDAAPAAAPLPVVVFSHGTGSTPWAIRGLAMHLARDGFAVALVEHPGNSRADDSLANTPANLANRPRHLRFVLDALPSVLAVDSTAAVIGHSLGAYTALAVAGGRPLALPEQTPDGKAHPVPVEPDPRVRALVLLAPAIPWFMAPGALADVKVPVFVRVGERDELAPPHFVRAILRDLPVDYAVVPGGGHFAFFYPVPPALASLLPGQDPPGFDRAAYQPQLCAEVTAFLRR